MNVAIQLLLATVSSLLRQRGQEDVSEILDEGLAFWRRGVSGKSKLDALNARVQGMVDEDRDPTQAEVDVQDEAIEAAEDAVLDVDLSGDDDAGDETET